MHNPANDREVVADEGEDEARSGVNMHRMNGDHDEECEVGGRRAAGTKHSRDMNR